MSKRKADEGSGLKGFSEPASHHPPPGHMFDDGSAAEGSTGKQAAKGSQQLGLIKGGLEYAEVVARCARPQQPSGPHKPLAMGLDEHVCVCVYSVKSLKQWNVFSYRYLWQNNIHHFA